MPSPLAHGLSRSPTYYGATIRGRLAMYDHPYHRGPAGSRTALYLELEEYSNSVGPDPEVYVHSVRAAGRVDCTAS